MDGTEAGTFQAKEVNIMAANALVPCIPGHQQPHGVDPGR